MNSSRTSLQLARSLVLVGFSLLTAAKGSEPDPRLVPGNEIVLKFPEFPTDARGFGAVMRITLPENYDPEKVFPVFLFMNGGKGSSGNLPELVEHRDFISVGMPIFLKDDAKPEGRYIVSDRDAENLWKYHKPMLERLHALIPNINRNIGLAAGFSNGANSIRCLVELTDGEYRTYFNRYIFCEGGTLLYDAGKLNGPVLGVAGDRAMGIPNRPGNVRDTVVNPALARGVDAEYILMKDTRHEFNPAYYPQVRDWIDRKVLNGGLEKNLETLEESVRLEKWPEALKAHGNVVLLTGPDQAERIEADGLLQSVNAAGGKAWAALQDENLSAEEVVAFVDAWFPCEVANTALAEANPLGRAALSKLLSSGRPQLWKKLNAFIRTWNHFPVAREARSKIEDEGRIAQQKVEAMPDGDAKIQAWNDLMQRYPDTGPAAVAFKEMEAAWKSENMALFQISDDADRIARLGELMALFAGTRHENGLRKRFLWNTEPQKEWRPWILEREAKRAAGTKP